MSLQYINIYGCDYWYSSQYAVPDASVNVTDTPEKIEALLVNGEAQNFKAADWCIESVPKPALTALFFVFFIVISALVMLSLFVGAVSMGMAEAVQEMKDIDYQSVSGR